MVANDKVNLQVFPSEIHCILGENGAGKSTLMKMLYGVTSPTAAGSTIDGNPARLSSPIDARRPALGMVFQDFRLVPALTVLENVALAGHRAGRDFRAARLPSGSIRSPPRSGSRSTSKHRSASSLSRSASRSRSPRRSSPAHGS